MFRAIKGEDGNGTAIESANPDNWGVSWATVSAKKAELDAAEPLKLLRAERDRRLAETDWWASTDLQSEFSGARGTTAKHSGTSPLSTTHWTLSCGL